ncbi:hypothetical protein D3C81_1781060 [compost metagenome]
MSGRQPFHLGDHIDYIHPESIDTFIKPEGDHLVQRFAKLRIFPVQIRLFAREQMQKIFACSFIQLPGRAAEDGTPIVGPLTIRTAGPPDIVIPVGIVLGRTGFREPCVFIGGMIDDKIHHQLHPAAVQPA